MCIASRQNWHVEGCHQDASIILLHIKQKGNCNGNFCIQKTHVMRAMAPRRRRACQFCLSQNSIHWKISLDIPGRDIPRDELDVELIEFWPYAVSRYVFLGLVRKLALWLGLASARMYLLLNDGKNSHCNFLFAIPVWSKMLASKDAKLVFGQARM